VAAGSHPGYSGHLLGDPTFAGFDVLFSFSKVGFFGVPRPSV
jgi:hypothetical protein